VAPCNDVWKYFYTGAHLQYMGYKAVLEFFFQVTSGWSKWCAQTFHPFSQILTIFSRIGAPIVAPPSDNFENCSIGWKGLFFRKKCCKQRLNRSTNADAMSCRSNSTTHQSGRRPTSVIFKKVKKITFRPLAPTCDFHEICMVIEVVSAIILGRKHFWLPSIVLKTPPSK